VLKSLSSIQGFVIFVPGTKVENQVTIETEVSYGRTISRTANLYSKRRQSKNKRKRSAA
jgi:hypothetical protein